MGFQWWWLSFKVLPPPRRPTTKLNLNFIARFPSYILPFAAPCVLHQSRARQANCSPDQDLQRRRVDDVWRSFLSRCVAQSVLGACFSRFALGARQESGARFVSVHVNDWKQKFMRSPDQLEGRNGRRPIERRLASHSRDKNDGCATNLLPRWLRNYRRFAFIVDDRRCWREELS